jgi:hypothetical protein
MNPRNSVLMAAALILTLPLAPLTARAGANDYFAGEWVLDTKRTEPGAGVPTEIQQTVTFEGDNVRVTRTVQRPLVEPVSYEYIYDTSGAKHLVFDEFPRQVTAGWDGGDLVVEWSFPVQTFTINASEVWKKRRSGMMITYTFTPESGDSNVAKFYLKRPE